MKSNKKNLNTKKSFFMKYKFYFVFIIVIIVTIVVFVSNVVPKKIMGSLYDINDVSKNIDNIKVGDSINYEINGYSDWKVLYIDKKNNTIDVISNTSPETLTFKGKEGYDVYLQTLQEHANAYVDGNIAIKARSVNKADLDNFTFDEEIWLANIYDDKVATNSNTYQLSKNESYNYNRLNNMYYLPYIKVYDEDLYSYDNGDIYNFSINGVDEWFVVGRWDYGGYNNRGLELIPKDPIKIQLTDVVDGDLKSFINNLLNGFDDPRVYEKYRGDSNYINYNSDIVKDYYISNYKKANFIRDIDDRAYSEVNYDRSGFYVNLDYYNGSVFSCCNGAESNDYVYFYTYGFRPVVTLKISDDVINEKDLNTDLQIGDYVNYSASGYQNWKVLSIDKDNNTADIISGGIVKNLELKGKDGYDNLESLLEEEVSKYKTDGVVSARSVDYSDLDNLNSINDRVNSKYWINNKKNYNRKYNEGSSAKYYSVSTRVVGVMYFDESDNQNKRDWIVLTGQTADNISMTSDVFKEGSYIAGIRPVLTVKLEEIEKVEDDVKEEIINNTKDEEKTIVKEQNKNVNNNTSISDKKLNEIINNSNVSNDSYETVTNNDNSLSNEKEIIKIIDKDDNVKCYRRFVVGALITIIVIFIINTIIAFFILKKFNARKK